MAASDEELRTLGFIPAFLCERTPSEVLAFMGMKLVDKGPADLVWDGETIDVDNLGFYVAEKENVLMREPIWLKVHKGVWQLAL